MLMPLWCWHCATTKTEVTITACSAIHPLPFGGLLALCVGSSIKKSHGTYHLLLECSRMVLWRLSKIWMTYSYVQTFFVGSAGETGLGKITGYPRVFSGHP